MNPTLTFALNEFLALAEALLPALALGSVPTAVIEAILTGLTQLVPTITSLSSSALTSVQNLISGLRQTTNITQAQLDKLDAFDIQIDAAFDAAANAAGADTSL